MRNRSWTRIWPIIDARQGSCMTGFWSLTIKLKCDTKNHGRWLSLGVGLMDPMVVMTLGYDLFA
jgi:hypothetical protein